MYVNCWSFDEQVQVLLSLLVIILHHYADAATCACATDAVIVRDAPGVWNDQVHVMYPGWCLQYLGVTIEAGDYYWRRIRLGDGDIAYVPSNWVTIESC